MGYNKLTQTTNLLLNIFLDKINSNESMIYNPKLLLEKPIAPPPPPDPPPAPNNHCK